MKQILPGVILSFCFHLAIAQTRVPILERRVSVSLSNEKLTSALVIISQSAKFSFSYNSAIISNDQVVTLTVENKSVRELLNEIFRGTMEYKEKSNHLILSRAPVRVTQVSNLVVISGYVQDAVTGERLADVSVYEKKSFTSTITDQFGYFKIKLEKKEPLAVLEVSKIGFRDSLVTIAGNGTQYVNISINRIETLAQLMGEVPEPKDSVKEVLSLPYSEEPNTININDPIYRDISISFLPFIGSNGDLSGNVINNYSINIFGGYSRGTKQIELGFFVNIDREDVSFLQIAGLGNMVGGDAYGVQASGLFNINGGESKLAQLTGGCNINFNDFTGVQVSGLGNVNLESIDGVQVAGLTNFSKGISRGVQIAGINNFQGEHYIGSQIAGITNFAASNITGSQISGIFNYGKKIHGTQIGLFNFADSLGGVPIGLISFVNHGYHKLEVSADEVFYTNLAFRTGVEKFYNIITAGIKPVPTPDNKPVWSFGYGIGTAPRLSRWMNLNIDLTAQHVNNGAFTDQLSLLNKLHVGFDFRLARKFSLYTGLTLNGYLTNSTFSEYPVLFNEYNPNIIYDHTFSDNKNLKMWFGAKIALRFF
jgi:hypothetical protein